LVAGTPGPWCGTATDGRTLILRGVLRRITTGSDSRKLLHLLGLVAVVACLSFGFSD